MKYIVGLIDDLVAKGVAEKRMMLGRFSQGNAMSLPTGLVSNVLRQLVGLVCFRVISLDRQDQGVEARYRIACRA